jgi:hypothetical protein
MDGALSLAEIRRFLKDYTDEMAGYLDELRRYEAEQASSMPPLARLVFQHGLAAYAGGVDGGERALRVLKSGGKRLPRSLGQRRVR